MQVSKLTASFLTLGELWDCLLNNLGIGRGKATNILRDFPSNFTVKLYTDKIKFYLNKQITFLIELSETMIGNDYRIG